MPTVIVKLTDGAEEWYLMYSTIVDAPVTWGMTRAELVEAYREEYGASGLRDLPGRLLRVDARGTSCYWGTAESELQCNRAGHDETHLTMAEIVEWYCRRKEHPPEGIGVAWDKINPES